MIWYQDRSPGPLPAAWVFSTPILVYRLLMLFWALWLAFNLLSWLRWGWQGFAEGGYWRRRPPKPVKPVVNNVSVEDRKDDTIPAPS